MVFDLFPNPKQKPDSEADALRMQLAEAERKLQRLTEDQELLDHIVRTINRELDFHRVLKSVLDQGMILIQQAQSGAFFLYDPRYDLFRIEAVYGYELESVRNVLLTRGEAARRYADWTYRIREGMYLIRNVTQERPGAAAVRHLPQPRAMLAMSVNPQSETIGYIVFDNFTNPNAFDECNLATLSRFRDHAMAAFSKARFIQEVRSQANDLEALDEIVSTVNREQDLDAIIRTLLHEGMKFIPPAEKSAFLMFDKTDRCFFIAGNVGYEDVPLESIRLTWEEAVQRYSLGAEQLREGVHLVSSFDRSRAGSEKLSVLPMPRSMLAMTVIIQGEIFGFIVFDNFSRTNAFNTTDLLKLGRFRIHATSALAKAVALREMHLQAHEMELIDSMVKQINREMGYEGVLRSMLEQGRVLIPQAQSGVFLVLNDDEQLYRPVVSFGYADGELDSVCFTPEEAMERYSVGSRKLYEGVYVVRPHKQQLAAAARVGHIRTPVVMLAMTVVLEGAILGFIILDNFEQENAFDYSDLRRFQRFRDHAVNAFAKARYLREIELQKQLITDAKQVIEAKNKDITDSILYAKRIQEALLPGEAAIQKALPQSFVLYLPKDIVSGDFYWFASVGGKHIVVVADCTGHGVPGAFMSVMGNTVLNMLVNERGITEPDKILTELNREVKGNLFRYDPQARSNDGMEVAIVAIEPQAKKFTFAGANRPLFYVHFGEMNVIKGDPAPIGGGPMATEAPFTALEFPITAGDMLFLASDGYQDQFGGPDFRKFKIKAMRELMHAIHAVPPDQQRGILHKAHTDWRGYHEQTDDILIIGIKFA